MKRVFAIAALLIACAVSGFAQGVQTGTLRGTVKDQQGLAVPGATITVTSPALQGQRTVVSGADGLFTMQFLPPGPYEVKVELEGFTTITQSVTVPLGGVSDQMYTLNAAGISTSVEVVAEKPAPIATGVVGANYKHEEIEELATPRTLEGVAQLSPGLTENTPNGGQVAINGAFAFDNVFMINGVDVNDNLFGNPQNLFIEDAIEETQVLTSGISAEYGRFSGGVINAVTKSGGNMFSGSLRVNFLNPAWSTETPFQTEKHSTNPNTLQETYEGTLGGPILKDKIWFFGAGRYANTEAANSLVLSGDPYVSQTTNKRGEIKVTATPFRDHTFQGGYNNNATTATDTSGLIGYVADPKGLVTRSLPNAYEFFNYRGTLKNNLLLEAQYSQRNFRFQGDGGTSTNIQDSPFMTVNMSPTGVFNAPYFSANDPEQRNNRQFTANATYYVSNLAGRHEFKGGYEFFRSQRMGGNSQSSTSYVFDSDFLTDAKGNPVYDASGNFVPVFVPGVSAVDYYPAVIGATLNVDTQSAYIQDHWIASGKLSLDLGTRYEHVNVLTTPGDIVSANAGRWVPRAAAAYDINGDGNHIVHVTYAWYSGRYNEAQIGANSPVGNPADIYSYYQGPAGQGMNFGPGFNIANYPVNSSNASVSVPTANIFMDPNLKSPLVKEVTASYGTNLFKGRGYGEVSYVHRDTSDVIEDFRTLDGGTTDVSYAGVNAGEVTNIWYRNTNLGYRKYDGMVFQSRYKIRDNWSVNGHYSLMLRDRGNYEGEGTNTPGATSIIGNYPEAFDAARNYPDGNLQDFQRSRLRLWSIYMLNLGRAGNLSASGMLRADSGWVYSLRATGVPLTSIQKQILINAGYVDLPSSQTLYFGDRGSQSFNGYYLVDMSINYDIPVWKTAKPYVKFDVYNLLNNQTQIQWNTTVKPNYNGPVDALGLPTTYTKAPAFGTMSANSNFPVPFAGQIGGRTFRVAAGFRF